MVILSALLLYYQPQWVTFTGWTALFTLYHKLAQTKTLQNFWLTLIIIMYSPTSTVLPLFFNTSLKLFPTNSGKKGTNKAYFMDGWFKGIQLIKSKQLPFEFLIMNGVVQFSRGFQFNIISIGVNTIYFSTKNWNKIQNLSQGRKKKYSFNFLI